MGMSVKLEVFLHKFLCGEGTSYRLQEPSNIGWDLIPFFPGLLKETPLQCPVSFTGNSGGGGHRCVDIVLAHNVTGLTLPHKFPPNLGPVTFLQPNVHHWGGATALWLQHLQMVLGSVPVISS